MRPSSFLMTLTPMPRTASPTPTDPRPLRRGPHAYSHILLETLYRQGGTSPLVPLYLAARTYREARGLGVPRSVNDIVRRTVQTLAKRGLTAPTATPGTWCLTEAGLRRALELVDDE